MELGNRRRLVVCLIGIYTYLTVFGESVQFQSCFSGPRFVESSEEVKVWQGDNTSLESADFGLGRPRYSGIHGDCTVIISGADFSDADVAEDNSFDAA